MATLAAAGIETGALVAPILPGVSDRPDQLRAVVTAIRDAGGRVHGIGPLHLRPGVREHFLGWLQGFDTDLHADYLRRYAGADHAPQRYVDELYARAGIEPGPERRPTHRPGKGPNCANGTEFSRIASHGFIPRWSTVIFM